MVMKVLLARFTRAKADGEDGETETLLPNGKPVDLTKEDLATLDNLSKSTGKRYYRDPVNEGGATDEALGGDDFTMPTKTADLNALGERLRVDLSTAKNNGERAELLQAHIDEHGMEPAPAGDGGDKDAGL